VQIETLQDVLHWAQKYHAQLESCLQQGGDTAENERAALLLHYLADHEEKLAQALIAFEQQAALGTLATWCVDYLETQPILSHDACTAALANLSTAEIMEGVVYQHEQIVALYRNLESRLPAGHAQKLLSDLAAMEEHESMQMFKNFQQLEDF
jgi:hypothetical protein